MTKVKKERPLTIKQKKFIANKIKGLNNPQAYRQAGYKASNSNVANVESSKLLNKPNIQKAIDKALEAHDLSPEVLVGELAYVVKQNDEIGAKRLAIKDGLELHGWRKDERPQATLQINNAFFSDVVSNKQDVIDV